MIGYIEEFIKNNCTCYLIPSIPNYKGYDSFLFIHKSQLSSIKIKFPEDAGHLLIGIQIKKDFSLICKKRTDINKKYEDKKKELKKIIEETNNQDLKNMNWAFMLVCQKESSENEWQHIKNVENEEILFLFTDENENEKIFKK